jgi:hypothetical protein
MAGGASTNGTGGAPPQAGVLEGINPIKYDPANPILLFIIQASVASSCFRTPMLGAGTHVFRHRPGMGPGPGASASGPVC